MQLAIKCVEGCVYVFVKARNFCNNKQLSYLQGLARTKQGATKSNLLRHVYPRKVLGDRFVAQNRLWLLTKISDCKITFYIMVSVEID